MGKQSKLKKIRKLAALETENLSHSEANDPNQFIKNLERQGYSLKRSQQAPDIPEKRVDPQI
jgi:hypothetical protein